VFNVVNPRAARGNNPWSGGTCVGRNVPRYIVKADGIVYDRVASSSGGASPTRMKKGTVKFFNESKGFGLTRLLESIQDEAKGFSSLIR